MTRAGAVWMLVATLGLVVAAQEPKLEFEVASVKPQPVPHSAATAATAGARVSAGGVFNSSHITVELLLEFAHDLKPYQIIGGPDWLRQEMFQIEARAGRDASRDEIKRMVQRLLADRFKLASRREQREMRVEALVLARPDGRLGPGLRRVDDCVTAQREMARQPPTMTVGASSMSGCSAGLAGLAMTLSLDLHLGKPVIDASGLTGRFHYLLTARSVAGPAPASSDASDPRHSPLVTALEEQLGLKLEARRIPLDVLVVESIQRPTEN